MTKSLKYPFRKRMVLLVVASLFAIVALVSWLLHRRKSALSLSGEHVFITGGSQGLGLEFANLCASKGAHVSIAARSEKTLAEARKEIEKQRQSSSQQVKTFTCDVTVESDMESAIKSAEKTLGPVSLLVANAGMSIPKLFCDSNDSEMRQMMEVNLFGSLNAARAVLPSMRASRSGRIVFVASAMSLTAFAGFSGYCASKWAIRGFAECLQSEIKPYNVDISVYYATTMDTPGLSRENSAKPFVTTELESVGESISAKKAAEILFRGLSRNQFEISADLGAELMSMGALMSPYHNLVLRTILAPLISLLGAVWRWGTRRVAMKHLQKNHSGLREAK